MAINSMKVVIPYKQCPNDGLELKYAIRSIYKHFRLLDNIVIVGDLPTWYKGDHIPMGDIKGRKEYSIYRKLTAVSGEVFYSNDDFFYLQDFDRFPNYYWQTCADARPRDRTYKNLYRACHPHWLNFDIHCGMIIDTTKFIWDIDRPIKTYYGNQNAIAGTELRDCKIIGDWTTADIRDEIKGRPVFSTNGNAYRAGMARVLNDLYPQKSPVEK